MGLLVDRPHDDAMLTTDPKADELNCFISTFNNAHNLVSPADTDTGGRRGPWIAYRPKIDNNYYSCGHYMLFCEKNNPDAKTRSYYNLPNFRGYDNHCFFKNVAGLSFAVCLTKDKKDLNPRKIVDVVFPFDGPVTGDNAGGVDNQWHLSYRMDQIMEVKGQNLRPTLDPKAVGERKCFMSLAESGMPGKYFKMDQQSNQAYSLYCTNAVGDMTNLPKPNWRGLYNLCYWEVKDEMSAFPSKDLAWPGTFVTCVVFEKEEK
ncbi:hypothetical protein BCR37DRAFT_385443 [Protomyces lactucae-debilis]|uniref:Uncharacterized protein n=1 Tax=Protomyces lactucae-debilis TaxID=2754530 RepID=A0A1Y2FWG8_PROLT|nr:uncharacterized protein BCR37DRAFT_385443 [Protomyces lactucae-debilis]ORY87005.1 hypothetical protein BCR37DRAFT_385443 [Protomyces lactucae-debilis]